MLRTFALLSLVAAAAIGAPAPQGADEAVDVVFVVDASNSMAKSDPDQLGRSFLEAVVDFLQGRTGDRVALVQFAGWYETQEKKVVAFPLTPIPGRDKLQEFRKSFGEAFASLKVFGQASDINVAFKEGLEKIAASRGGAKNPWWVVVVTDGDFDVLEPDKVRPEYKDLAETKFGGADVDTINQAAGEIFKTKTRADFVASSGSALTMSGISLARDPAGNKRIQDIVGEKAPIGNLTATPLKDLLVPLLGTSPLLRRGKSGFYGYASGKTSVPLHVYEGSIGTRAMVYSRGGKLTGKLKTEKGSVEILGGDHYLVAHLRDVPAGDYTLEIEGAGSTVEAVAWAEFPHALEAKLASKDSAAAGQKIAVDVAAKVMGKAVTDAKFLSGLKVKLQVTGPAGTGVQHDVVLKPDATGRWEMTAEVPGDYAMQVSWSAVPEGVEPFTPVVLGGPIPLKANVRHGLAASFGVEKPVWLGEEAPITVSSSVLAGPEQKDLVATVPVKDPEGKTTAVPVTFQRGTWTGKLKTAKAGTYEILGQETPAYVLRPGSVPKLTVRARIFTAEFSAAEAWVKESARLIVRGEGSPGTVTVRRDGKETKLDVKANPQSGGIEASIPTDEPGVWEVVPEAGAGLEVRAKDPAKLTVKARTFGVFVKKDGKLEPAKEITVDAKYWEKGRYPTDLVILLDVRSKEGAQITASPASKQEAAAALLLEQNGKPLQLPTTVTWEPGRLECQLVLDVRTDGEIPERPGSVKFKGEVVGLKFEQDVEVKVVHSDKTAKIFKKLLPWILLGLTLLLLLLWFLLLARWKDHQLRYFQNNNLDTKHYLRNLNAGFMKRSATGTPEVPSAVSFRHSGMKFTARKSTAMPMKSALTVQGQTVNAATPLKHGDEVVVSDQKSLYRYIYFEKEPTPEELQAALAGLIAGDEIFLEEE